MSNLDLRRPLLRVLLASLGAATLAIAGCGGGDGTGIPTVKTTLSVKLSGDQENPRTTTGAIGTGTLTLTMPDSTINGSITLDGVTASAAHIHQGAVGSNGPIIVPMTETAPGSGVWTFPANTVLTEAQVSALTAGGLYFNAHSADNPGGDLRGQIGVQVSAAQLAGAQENPPTASAATGNGLLSLDPATKRISARLTLPGLAATAAHIHDGAIGVNGPIIVPLTETPAGSGVWLSAADAVLTDAQIATLASGGLYFNAHSTALPGGEIRGQIGRNVRYATLRGAEEVPPTASAASGSGILTIDPATRAATGRITLTGLAATQAHIHLGAVGVNGAIIVPLTETPAASGVWVTPANAVLTADQFKAFKQGNLYFNAHSPAFPGGEIRGQIR